MNTVFSNIDWCRIESVIASVISLAASGVKFYKTVRRKNEAEKTAGKNVIFIKQPEYGNKIGSKLSSTAHSRVLYYPSGSVI